MGAAAAFIILNYTSITEILYPPPRLRLSVEDAYLKQVGTLSIYRNTNTSNPFLKTSIAEALDWLPLEQGAYRLELTINDNRYFTRELFLYRGDRETLVIPKQMGTQTIQVTVFNNTPHPPPGSPLHLRVISSGNGFLWIYDLSPEGNPSLVYPGQSGIRSQNHAITAGEPFTIPDPKQKGIFVSNEPGEENLLVVVTSSGQRTTADKIASRMSKAGIAKARGGRIEENWGITLLHYRVSL